LRSEQESFVIYPLSFSKLILIDGRWGVFRLTDPPGMQCVRACTKPGIFHPHEESNIYTDALRPGHVFEAEGLEFTIVDLRPAS
jgi:STAM-binding protein